MVSSRVMPAGGGPRGHRPSAPVAGNDVSDLTRDRIFGEDQNCQELFFPAPAGRATRPSGGLFRFWARELLANQREHSARRCDALSTERDENQRERLALPFALSECVPA